MVNDEAQIGFYYADLKKVARLLELVNEKLISGTVSYSFSDRVKFEMIDAMMALLDVLKVPFVK